MAHEERVLVKQDFGITLNDLDERLELTSYFLSPTGPTHLDKLLFVSLNLHTNEGEFIVNINITGNIMLLNIFKFSRKLPKLL